MPLPSTCMLAYGCRYCYRTPHYKHLTLLCLPLPHHYFPTARFRTFSFFHSSPLLTGNSLFSRMEKYFSGTGGGKNKNKAMVEQLQCHGVFNSDRVAEVMETIDRALFVPPGTPAYVDSPMPIGHNATISAPHMHAMCLELLKDHLQPGMHALDVGSGTGYLTACFAMMVGLEGRAVGIEHIPELVTWSIENIKKSAAAPLLEEGSMSVHVGDGRLGYPEAAPYDAIHVGAAAPEIPKALVEQLKPGGRLVIPVGTFFQDLQVVDKQHDGSLKFNSGVFNCITWKARFANQQVPTLLLECWSKLAPLRVEVLVWLAIQDKLNTKERLLRRGIVEEAASSCAICNEAFESNHHLFIACKFASKLWDEAKHWWNVFFVVPGSLEGLFDAWIHMKTVGSNIGRKGWKTIFFVIIDLIWNARNRAIFEGKTINVDREASWMKLRTVMWLKSAHQEIPYSPSEMVENVHMVKFWKMKRRKQLGYQAT